MSIRAREVLRRFLFGGRPDRLSWWQHALCWGAAVIVVSIPAVWAPAIQQHRNMATAQACPRVEPQVALATPPPEGYAVPSGCCGATSVDAADPAAEVKFARESIRSGRFAVTACDWFSAWGMKSW